MRILRVTQNIYPDVKGGATYHAHAMSRDQAKRGHQVTLLTVRQDPELPHIEKRDGYTVVRYDPIASPLGNDISPGLAQYLRNATGFDVIHAHSHLYFATNLAALKQVVQGTPLAVTNHGLYSQSAPEWVFDLYLRTVGRWTFEQADVIFCYTDADRNRVREFGVDSRIEVVHNGVDTTRFAPNGPASDRISHDGPVVLFVGRLVEGKRPHDAIQAVEQLSGEVRLCVVGDGPLRAELKAASGPETRFLGQVPYDEMPTIYRTGDALVLPSRAEGLPRTVLEAFATGLPVVASNLRQVAPVVEQAGETVSVGNVAGFAAAIERVLGEVAGEPRRVATEGFDWAETVQETTSVLEGL